MDGTLKWVQEQLRLSEERFDLALRGANLATWDWNVQTGEVAYNSRWAEMRGCLGLTIVKGRSFDFTIPIAPHHALNADSLGERAS